LIVSSWHETDVQGLCGINLIRPSAVTHGNSPGRVCDFLLVIWRRRESVRGVMVGGVVSIRRTNLDAEAVAELKGFAM